MLAPHRGTYRTLPRLAATEKRSPQGDRKGMAMATEKIEAVLIPVDGWPVETELECDDGSALEPLQGIVGGFIEPFDALFGDRVTIYVNDEGLWSCPPNRAIFATKRMKEEGFVSQADPCRPVEEDELYTILHGDIVAVGFDPETGEDRSLSAAEKSEVMRYFAETSPAGSGLLAMIALKMR